jgi:hypothetical protein
MLPARIQEGAMNKRYLLSVVVMFVLLMVLGFVVHGLVLSEDYARLTTLFRSPETTPFHLMVLAHVLTAFAFVWVYQRGKEDKPFLAQGIRYGLAMALIVVVPKYLIYYVVQPMPGLLAFKQIVLDTIAVIIMAVVVARLNK